MQRKIIKQGIGGYTIYLPSKWVSKNNLDKGDLVSLNELDGDIILSSSKKDPIKKELNLEISRSSESSIRTLITNAYRLGYTNLKISYKEPSVYYFIKNSIPHLMGFEIISNKDNLCVIESLSEPEEGKAEQMFLKFLFLIEELFDHIRQLLTSPHENFDYLKEIEDRIKRYDNFCRRVVLHQSKTEQLTSLKLLFYNNLMHAQRELFFLGKYQHSSHTKASKNIVSFFEESYSLFSLLKKAYLKRSVNLLEELHGKEKDLVENKAYSLIERTKGKEAILLYRIATTARKFYLCASPLMGLFLMKEAKA